MPKLPPLTFATHQARWKNCRLCDLAEGRMNVVLLRGTVPAQVLFCGEAPGHSENANGVPFVKGAPAGSLLQKMIERAGVPEGAYAVTNIVACIPKDDDGAKVHAPPEYAVEACRPRLLECVKLVQPRLIVWVGKEAEAYGPGKLITPPMVAIKHPASILRMEAFQRPLEIQKCIVTIAEAYESYCVR